MRRRFLLTAPCVGVAGGYCCYCCYCCCDVVVMLLFVVIVCCYRLLLSFVVVVVIVMLLSFVVVVVGVTREFLYVILRVIWLIRNNDVKTAKMLSVTDIAMIL